MFFYGSVAALVSSAPVEMCLLKCARRQRASQSGLALPLSALALPLSALAKEYTSLEALSRMQ